MKVRRAVAGAVFAAGLGAGTLAGTGVAQATPPTPTPLLAQLLQHQGNGHEANHPGKVVAGLATGDLEESLVQSWKTHVEAPVVTAIDDRNAGTANADLLYCDDWNPGNSENWLGAEDCSTGGGGAGLSLLPGGVPGPTPDPGPTDPGPTNPGPTPDPGPGPGNGGDNGNGSGNGGGNNGGGNGNNDGDHDGDHDNGHGNDEDGHDESNPGNGGGNGPVGNNDGDHDYGGGSSQGGGGEKGDKP